MNDKNAFKSLLIANVGISMGDEGKGRIVYELIDEINRTKSNTVGATTVIKVNGGANSGHTAAGLKLNLIPSGVTVQAINKLILGSGVVADPRKLLWESKSIEDKGHPVLSRLLIDEKTQVSDITHRLLDLAIEEYRSKILNQEPRGSTGRGISPAYSDETGLWQIHYLIFKKPKAQFEQQMRERIDRAMAMIQHVYKLSENSWHELFQKLTDQETKANQDEIDNNLFPIEEFDFSSFKGDQPFTLNIDYTLKKYWEAGNLLLDNIVDIRDILINAINQGESIIGEFGQSFWLDKRHGFVPNVTASHTYTPEFFLSTGIPLQPIHTVACAKAYDTKVGQHHFITQMPENHPLAIKLKKVEYGTSTGRQRMVGWFDAVEKGTALRYCGYNDLAINKLDALTYKDDWQGGELLICVGYRDPEGNRYYTIPRNEHLRRSLHPVYIQYPGWDQPLHDIRSFDQLPENAQRYVIGMISSIIAIANYNDFKCPLPSIRYIGVGSEPGQIIKDIPDTLDLIDINNEQAIFVR